MTTTQDEPDTVIHVYTMNDGTEIINHTDPTGLWHAGVAATIWDSSLILSKHFEKSIQDAKAGTGHHNPRVTTFLQKPDINVLELGAGCSALPSVVLSRLLCTDHSESKFIVTDKDTALPLLRKSIGSNVLHKHFDVHELDWLKELSSNTTKHEWDVVLASDLLAFPELYESLNNTLKAFCTAQTLVYIAYERRNFSVEVDFFKDLGKNFQFEMVREHELDDVWQAPGEIYLYRAWLRT
ncbi:protein of unknown function [Taphrina deformans PYCC 5710]|uniref:Uncharacterized protein n=1 Tax=Taphrina deformans (strain PYCC 5710 / ATCC 11124 / CBS 356.35 / IMI 108563 / JCM 9778 / NBRC 8474) TaxID=1097556 RepID=R4XNP3_TAPDE|nr:protein of unknown function [Taphrina deformans PYCC 5710]|eukprot:CCG84866.1 protein of unknown function [Taphrina deformans PYCC 5710]